MKPKKVQDFNPQSQNPGSYPENPLAQGPRKGVVGGGSKPTPQTNLPEVELEESSAPKHPQRIRG